MRTQSQKHLAWVSILTFNTKSMKKKYNQTTICTLFIILSIVLSGCEDFRFGNDFLEKRKSTDLTKDEVFSNKIYAEQALSEVYRTLPDLLPQEIKGEWASLDAYTDLGDYRRATALPLYYSGNLTAANTGHALIYNMDRYDKRGPWSGIRNAYIYLENVDRVPDMTEREKEIRKGEAKTIMAYHYTDMFRYFGGLPWVNHAYVVDEDFYNPRMTVEATVDSIVMLLDEAAAVLPWSVNQADDGRMTKASAMALKVRVLLHAASPIFNNNEPYAQGEAVDEKLVWYGNYDAKRWERVLNAGLDFVRENETNGVYDLVKSGNPREDFLHGYFNRNNGEVLISSRWHMTYQNNDFYYRQLRYGITNPTLNLVDMYPMSDGSDFSWDNPEHAQYPFFKNGQPTRDVRLYETCIINEDRYKGRQAQTYVGGREYNNGMMTRNGFGFRKFVQDEQSSVGKPYQSPLLRLPEIYLSIAEALNELNRGDEAYAYINKIRNRAGLPNIGTQFSQSELREEILRERVLEFAFEECRYFDLVRHKRHDIFRSTAKIRILEIKKLNTGGFSYEILQSPSPRQVAEYWKETNILLPFPQNEINKKYGLIQNPGW